MTNKFAFISEKATAKFKKTVSSNKTTARSIPRGRSHATHWYLDILPKAPQKSLFVKSTDFSFQKKKKSTNF